VLLNRDRALEVMEVHGLDALVATRPENVHYLSDYGTQHSYNFGPWGISCAVLPRSDDIPPTLVVHEFEVPALAESPSWMPGLRALKGVGFYVPDVDALTAAERETKELAAAAAGPGIANRQRALGALLGELGLAGAALGFDDVRIMLELAENELADARVVDATNVFREVRLVKTPAELELLRHASKINQAALVSTASLAQEGVTCGELIRHYRSFMAAQGGYGSHVTGGGHDRPWISNWNTTYRLREGDILHLDPAGWYERYWADQGRTRHVGTPSTRFEGFYGALQNCHAAVDPMLQPGSSTAEIEEEARRAVDGTLPSEGFVVLTHSIGIEQYDQPQGLGEFLSEPFTLEVGMVVNFETLFFELGWGILQLEDSYLIRDGEPERLGTLPQEPFTG
jgi:Xaa-Pro aminopeptidase